MQYDALLAGSPLIPNWLIYLYGLTVFVIIFVLLIRKNKLFFKTLFLSLFLIHGLILLALNFAVLYLLKPIPRVIKTSYQPSKTPGTSSIEITFNKPLRRKDLHKSISPTVAGIWIFADPLYDTHLYRKVVFYPYSKLNPGTNYTVYLSGIRNFLNESQQTYTYAFKPPDVFDILGDAISSDGNDQLSIIGSFPANGWDGISADSEIRVRFNQPVNKLSAQSRFIINPSVEGTFSWDGETLIFTPKTYLDFDTHYTFSVSTGVMNFKGNLLNNSYNATFTTQAKSTKLTVPSYLQQYSLSCEAATLRMALAYRGVATTEDELLQKIGFDPNGKQGDKWGNPYVGFVGKVSGKQMKNGYGVYWEPVARAANNYRYSKSFENWTIKQLTESIQKSTPVIVWISIGGRQPTVWLTPTGDRIKAVPDEHTVLVVGFTGPPNNPSQIIVNDPLIGEAYWSKESFEKKWSSLSNSGVLVY